MMEKKIIGNSLLYCGDCLEIMPNLPEVDAVVTDPPYFLKIGNDCQRKLNQWSNLCNGSVFIREWLKASSDILKKDAAIWTFTNWQGLPAFYKACGDADLFFRSLLVWNKKRLGPGIKGLRPSYEMICLFTKGNFAIMDRGVSDLWEYSWQAGRKGQHPAEKPAQLLERLIGLVSGEKEIILDPFMGSGSTGVAAIKSGRKFIGIEQNQYWYEFACERIANESENAGQQET